MYSTSKVTILVVGDAIRDSVLLQVASLHEFNAQIIYAKNIKEAIKIILARTVDLTVIHYQLADGTAIEFLEAVQFLGSRLIPTIVVGKEQDEKWALHAFRKGARECLVEDKQGHYLQRIPVIIERLLKDEKARGARENKINKEIFLQSVSDGVIGLDVNFEVTFINPAATMYFNTSVETLLHAPVKQLFAQFKEEVIPFESAIKRVKKTNQPAEMGAYTLLWGKEKLPLTVTLRLVPLFDEMLHLEGYLFLVTDHSDVKIRNHDREENVDELTELLNKKAFMQRLQQTLVYCERYGSKAAVLLVNLDGFKTINEALGRIVGDELLYKIGIRLKSIVRQADLVARLGGDEFAILLTRVKHENDSGKVASKVMQALLSPFLLKGQNFYICASIGISLYPQDAYEANQLLHNANCALQTVKRKGKNGYQYYESNLTAQAEKMVRISNDLRSAPDQDQLDIYFQPQIEASSGRFIAFEALLRWHHPAFGMIGPSVFIPIAEEIGFIDKLGEWVVDHACVCCNQWEQQGLDAFRICINVSINELKRKDYVENITERVCAHGLSPSRFQIEITESLFLEDRHAVIQSLCELKAAGFQIAIDDFGTGYSCLSYLKDLPIDILKIDKSFIQMLSTANEKQIAIIASIIELAKKLNIVTLAEGVETKEQMEYLTTFGCDQLQGFLIAKPLPFERATQFIQKSSNTGKPLSQAK